MQRNNITKAEAEKALVELKLLKSRVLSDWYPDAKNALEVAIQVLQNFVNTR